MRSVKIFTGNESNYEVLVKYTIIDNLIEFHDFILNFEKYDDDLVEFIRTYDLKRKMALVKNFLKSSVCSVLSAEVVSTYFVFDFDGFFKWCTILMASAAGTVLFQKIYNKEMDKKLEKWDEEYISECRSVVKELVTDCYMILDNFIEYARIANLSDFDIECEIHKIFNEGGQYIKHKKDKNLVEEDFNSSVACDDIDYMFGIDIFNSFVNINIDASKVRIR